MKKCLVIRRYAYIGDLLMMTPCLRKLSQTYLIDIALSGHQEVFFNLPYIHKIYSLEDFPNKNNYDLFFDLSDYEYNYERLFSPNNISTPKTDLFLEAVKSKIHDFKLDIVLSDEEIAWAEEYYNLNGLKNKKTILLAIKSTSKSRDWDIENWKELIKKLKILNYGIIVVDAIYQWDDKEIIFFAAPNIRKLFAIVSKADYVLCNDSGILHIAGAFEIPTLGIFGPTDPKIRCIYNKSYWITNNLGIAPCWYEKEIARNYFSSISVGAVERKFLEVLENELG